MVAVAAVAVAVTVVAVAVVAVAVVAAIAVAAWPVWCQNEPFPAPKLVGRCGLVPK